MSKIKVTSHQAEVLNALENGVVKALTECGLVATSYAQEYCPVDTGRLRGSIAHKVSGNKCYIGTNVEYAAYVEFGTGSFYPGGSGIIGMRAQPYLKPAIANHVSTYKQIIADNLKS